MKRISRSTVFYKRVYPALLGAVALALAVAWAVDASGRSERSLGAVLVVFAVLVYALAVNWLLTAGLADEVLDAGGYLLVRMGAKSERVPIADIESVSEFPFTRPRRVTLRLVRPGALGNRIVFFPAVDAPYLIPLSNGHVTQDLAERVERARRPEP